jgi:nucleotide-binding universal stress UspA family protein
MLGDAVDALSERARASLEWAEAQAGGGTQVTSIVVAGDVLGSLMDTAERIGAGLIVIGTHGGRRLTSAVAAEPSAMVLHDAAGSVLVARQAFDPSRFPTRIVVGLDGSPLSRAALQVGASLRRRGDGRLIVVTAGKEQDEAAAALEGFDEPYEHLALPGRPVDVLVGAARSADVVIVGSRGLHGGKALGSVSERVAFRAESSVLVVRDAGSRPGA